MMVMVRMIVIVVVLVMMSINHNINTSKNNNNQARPPRPRGIMQAAHTTACRGAQSVQCDAMPCCVSNVVRVMLRE
jgi:hypothetical protein